MQRINVRLLGIPASVDAAIPEFHSWIQQGLSDELLIDVVDYRHVPAGPGVMLIGHEADYGLSESGLTYSRKTKHAGTPAEQIKAAFTKAKAAAERFDLTWNDFEVIVNDRQETPNTEANWQALKNTLAEIFPGAAIAKQGDHRTRLTARVSGLTT